MQKLNQNFVVHTKFQSKWPKDGERVYVQFAAVSEGRTNKTGMIEQAAHLMAVGTSSD